MSVRQITTLPELVHRPADGHKGTFGRVLIVAGSYGMSGAAALAGMGALRGGAGLVYLAVPDCILSIVAGFEPAYITLPISTIGNTFSSDALRQIENQIANKDAIAIGPGMGRSAHSDGVIYELYKRCEQPMVVDADALNALADQPERILKHAGSRILTPHPGEFERLTKQVNAADQKDRIEQSIKFAQAHNVVLVLKGAGTVVTDGQQFYVNTTGNAGMATGGTGDVLTGIITALLAGGYAPFAAAQLGVYLHGLAGDIATEELSQPALISSDLPKYLSDAWLQVLGNP